MNQETIEELEIIQSIYGTNAVENPLEIDTDYGIFTIQFRLHMEYPNVKPSFNIIFPTLFPKNRQIEWETECLSEIVTLFDGLFVSGEPIMYTLIEALREYLMELKLELDSSNNQQEVQFEKQPEVYRLDDHGYAIIDGTPTIYHSPEPLIEKKSVFVAHVAKVTKLSQVKLVHKTLLSNKHVAKATHNISAYRIVEENGVIRQDSDDDGETAAGSRLLHLLQLANVNNVYIVVSRWYGGVQLGSGRFKCINNCARILLEQQGFIN